MVTTPVYMDNHATTRTDPRVLDAMLPLFCQQYGNAGSTSHSFGWTAKAAVDAARESVAEQIGALPREIVFTSGATESNNLAIRGVCEHVKRRGNHLISVTTEHKAVLDPLARLSKNGFEVTLLPVRSNGRPDAGQIDLDQLAAAIRDDTALVSVMLANNEIGVLQPLAEIGQLCRARGVLLHTDATQAVGKLAVHVDRLQVDLMSFSGHKIYGPKGIGVLYVRRRSPQVRLEPQIDGGRQESGLRSGTANVPGVVGLAKALELCAAEMPTESTRLAELRNRLYQGLCDRIPGISLNGPALDSGEPADSMGSRGAGSESAANLTGFGHGRLAGNLNCCFGDVDGEALMMSMRDLAVSSGSACSSADPTPSHVLKALGLNDDQTRASLRFGLGRFNTPEEIDFAIDTVTHAVERLRQLTDRRS
ncbi:MAG: aminotransferase class V-fold PLP-dependent enzyme [Pirellulaceae bacterium]|nr:aminotransferase class V-fold PLP-dependent enzyme [Pirellulaceae bacterium]